MARPSPTVSAPRGARVARPWTRAGGRRRISAVLVVLLAVAAVQALAWAILMPPFQGPDEIGHFAYTQKLVEARTIPWVPNGGHISGPTISTELENAVLWGGVERLRANPAARPPGSTVAVGLWRTRDARLGHAQRVDGRYTPAMSNPPLYYLYAAIPYAAMSHAPIFDRALALRIWSIPLLLLVVAGAWVATGELLGHRRPLQILATTAVALQPQLVQMGALADPDIMLAAIWTWFLVLAIAIVRRGATRRRVAGLLALVVLSAFTHARGVSIVVPAVVTLGIAAWRSRGGPSLRRHRWLIGAGAVVAGLIGSAAVLQYATVGQVTAMHARQFVSYLWQFYLPRLPFMNTPLGPHWRVRDVFIDRFYSGFGQLEVGFSRSLLDAIAWAALVIIAGAIVGLVVHRRAARRSWDVVLVVVAAFVAYLLQLHMAAFRNLVTGGNDPVLTGRYLVPFVAVYGAVIALAVSWVPRRAAAVAAGAITGVLLLIALGSLGVLTERFYA
jgi:hypothetical protein